MGLGLLTPRGTYSPRNHAAYCLTLFPKMVTDQRPYQSAKKDYNVIRAISQGELPANVAGLDVETIVEALLVECWRIAPASRPSMTWCLQRLSERLRGPEGSPPDITPDVDLPSATPDQATAFPNTPTLQKRPGKNRRRKDKAKGNRSDGLPSIASRTASAVNVSSVLATGDEALPTPRVSQTTLRQSTATRTQTGILPSSAHTDDVLDTPPRRVLQLLSRSIMLTTDEHDDEDNGSDTGIKAGADANPVHLTEAQVKSKIEEDVKEFFAIRDLAEGEYLFQVLPEKHRSKLVDRLIGRAIDSKEDGVKLVADLFARVAGTTCSPASFEAGFAGTVEFLDDIAIDIPQAYPFMARLLQGSKLPQSSVEDLAAKIYADGDSGVQPKDKLLAAFAKID